MSMPTGYVLQPSEKTRCPKCDGTVDLLCAKSGNIHLPWFYICYSCKSVARVGRGEVEREPAK